MLELVGDLMPWARLEDNYFTNGKIAGDSTHPGLSKDAKLLDLAGIAFSARELRDGRLSGQDVRIVAAQVDVDLGRCLKELVTAGRWKPVAGGGGWEIHDYLVYNPTREKVLKDREEARVRMQEIRESRKPKARSKNGSAEHSSEHQPNVREKFNNPGPTPVNVVRDVGQQADLPPPASGAVEQKPERRGARVIDGIRAGGYEPHLSTADFASIKRSSSPPELIAEAFIAARSGAWDSQVIQENLSVQTVIRKLDAYVLWLENGKQSAKRNGFSANGTYRNGRNTAAEIPRKVVDHTGCALDCNSLHPERD